MIYAIFTLIKKGKLMNELWKVKHAMHNLHRNRNLKISKALLKS